MTKTLPVTPSDSGEHNLVAYLAISTGSIESSIPRLETKYGSQPLPPFSNVPEMLMIFDLGGMSGIRAWVIKAGAIRPTIMVSATTAAEKVSKSRPAKTSSSPCQMAAALMRTSICLVSTLMSVMSLLIPSKVFKLAVKIRLPPPYCVNFSFDFVQPCLVTSDQGDKMP